MIPSERSHRPLAAAVLAVVLSMPTALVFAPVPVAAAEAPPDWAHVLYAVVDNEAGALTDHPVKVVLDTRELIIEGEMEADCRDLRVEDVGGAVLAHWFQGPCDHPESKVWVKVPSLPVGSNAATLVLRHGNPDAVDASDCAAVLPVCHDFSDEAADMMGWVDDQRDEDDTNCQALPDARRSTTHGKPAPGVHKPTGSAGSVSRGTCYVGVHQTFAWPAATDLGVSLSYRAWGSSGNDRATNAFFELLDGDDIWDPQLAHTVIVREHFNADTGWRDWSERVYDTQALEVLTVFLGRLEAWGGDNGGQVAFDNVHLRPVADPEPVVSFTEDADGDGVVNPLDSCANGDTGWTSSPDTDHDADGCRDATEDTDDDNDTIADSSDSCPVGDTGWTSSPDTDHDADGCRDATEDPDDDNDTIADDSDLCPVGETGWTSSADEDNDADGCRDATEDLDDDNDTVLDEHDNCRLVSNSGQVDNDADGQGDLCDPDDDNDGLPDTSEVLGGCPNPFSADSDADGLGDGDEVAMGTDPCNADTDGDGATDGDEADAGSDPLMPDTDGDLYGDGQEIRCASDPTDAAVLPPMTGMGRSGCLFPDQV